jgi:hypothetical protein
MIHGTGKFTDSEMVKEAARLKTFDTWPVHSIRRTELAAAGFYFLYKDDWVRCPLCGVQLWNWRPNDDPLFHHKYMSRACRSAWGLYTANVPIASDEQ